VSIGNGDGTTKRIVGSILVPDKRKAGISKKYSME
jgi:hypothetical protein